MLTSQEDLIHANAAIQQRLCRCDQIRQDFPHDGMVQLQMDRAQERLRQQKQAIYEQYMLYAA